MKPEAETRKSEERRATAAEAQTSVEALEQGFAKP